MKNPPNEAGFSISFHDVIRLIDNYHKVFGGFPELQGILDV
jgi:hypothetical protein